MPLHPLVAVLSRFGYRADCVSFPGGETGIRTLVILAGTPNLKTDQNPAASTNPTCKCGENQQFPGITGYLPNEPITVELHAAAG